MTSATPLRRTLLVTLACVTLFAPAALARPVDPRAEAPTSSLSGTQGTVFEHVFDPYPEPMSRRDAALFGALVVGLGAGSSLHRVHTRRHGARLAT